MSGFPSFYGWIISYTLCAYAPHFLSQGHFHLSVFTSQRNRRLSLSKLTPSWCSLSPLCPVTRDKLRGHCQFPFPFLWPANLSDPLSTLTLLSWLVASAGLCPSLCSLSILPAPSHAYKVEVWPCVSTGSGLPSGQGQAPVPPTVCVLQKCS